MGVARHQFPDLLVHITDTGDLNGPTCGDHDIGCTCGLLAGGRGASSWVDQTRIWRNLNRKVVAGFKLDGVYIH